MEIDIIRTLCAFFAGYFLSLSGSLSQLISGNQIASPSTLGMDGLAVFFVLITQCLIVLFGLDFYLEMTSFLFSLLFLIPFSLIYIYKKRQYENIWDISNIKHTILIGLTFNLFIAAVFAVIQFIFLALNLDFPQGLWFGSFKQVSSDWIIIFTLFFLVSFFFVSKFKNSFIALNLGQDFATGRGVDSAKLQKMTISLCLFLTCLVISFFGVFSFLGLIAPHLIRRFRYFRGRIDRELITGPVLAGFALCALDVLCFNFIYQGAEIPAGMLSSIVGSLFLILLLLKSRV